jgi:hydroxymethylglutaryl-CoA synthase
VKTGLIAARIGNTYSASCLLALAAVLEKAQAGERILLASFGSGAGSDGLVLRVTENIDGWRRAREDAALSSIEVELGQDHADWLTYGQYARAQGKLAQ